MEALGINLQNIVIYTLLFVVLYLLIDKFFLKKILAVIDARQAAIDEGIKNSEEAKSKLENAENDYNKLVEEAKSEAKEIKDEARQQIESDRKRIIEEAKQEAASIVEKSNQRFEEYKTDYEKKVNAEIEKRARSIVKEVIGHDVELNSELIDKYIKQI